MKIEFRTLHADEIECRVAQNGTTWAMLLLYKDARVDQRLLDEVVGPLNWKRKHEVIGNNLYCIVSIFDPEKKDWVSKEDVGTESFTEKEKGQASDSFKRACFNWGIGRELYSAPKKVFVSLTGDDFNQKQKIKTRFNVASIGYDDNRNINKLTIVDDNGEVRFDWDKAKGEKKLVPKPKQTPIKQPVKKLPVDDDLYDAFQLIKPDIDRAKTKDDIRLIIENNDNLKNYPKFQSEINKKWKEVA
nr:hypothetical protein [uncultured Prevotella sp.]